MVVAGDWPGALVSLLCLNLKVEGAFFPAKFHRYFKPSKDEITQWQSTLAFQGVGGYHKDVFFLFSGSIDFLRRTLPVLEGCARVMIAIDIEREGAAKQ